MPVVDDHLVDPLAAVLRNAGSPFDMPLGGVKQAAKALVREPILVQRGPARWNASQTVKCSLGPCQEACFRQRSDDPVAVLWVGVQPPAAWVWYPQHGQVKGESRPVPAFLRLASTGDDNR